MNDKAGFIETNVAYPQGEKVEVVNNESNANSLSTITNSSNNIELENSFIGYGINVFNGSTYAGATTCKLFKDIVYKNSSTNDGISYINFTTLNETATTTVISNSLSEAYTKLDIGINLKTGKKVPFFSGSVRTQYGTETSLHSETKFYNSISSILTKKHTLNGDYRNIEKLRTIISDSVLEEMKNGNNDPIELFNKYGTHIITGCSMGGSASICALYDSETRESNRDISAAVEFKTGYAEGGGTITISDKSKNISDSLRISILATGGTSFSFAGNSHFDEIPKAFETWRNSFNTPGLTTLAKLDYYTPIWDLVSDKELSNKIEDAFYEKAENTSNYIFGYFRIPRRIQSGMNCVFLNNRSKLSLDNYNGKYVYLYTESDQYQVSQHWILEAVVDNGIEYFRLNPINCKDLYLSISMKLNEPDLNSHLNLRSKDSVNPDSQLFRIIINDDRTISLLSKIDEAYSVSGKGDVQNDKCEIVLKKNISDDTSKWILKSTILTPSDNLIHGKIYRIKVSDSDMYLKFERYTSEPVNMKVGYITYRRMEYFRFLKVDPDTLCNGKKVGNNICELEIPYNDYMLSRTDDNDSDGVMSKPNFSKDRAFMKARQYWIFSRKKNGYFSFTNYDSDSRFLTILSNEVKALKSGGNNLFNLYEVVELPEPE
ncbi:MAG: hypothetical protein LBC71_02400 [Oscillospiraceae bacterium]|jgi:hypothetical protein|nr:hypothetical protein [Oscillospiraceae bacterium]